MSLDSRQKFKLRKLLFIALLGMIAISIVLALLRRTEWIVPEDAKRRENPVRESADGLHAAQNLYRDNCAKCHGNTGKGDGPEAWQNYPSPTNLADENRVRRATDGELFYEISEGRRPMPGFQKRMSEEQRWELVNLIRSFSAAN
jgi:mono/diheme cytochrome c family protein